MLTSLAIGMAAGAIGYCGKEVYKTFKPEKKKIKNKEIIPIIENNTLSFGSEYYDFNDLFFNCGLMNKDKNMPKLKNYKNMKTVDIYTFKLPSGITASKVRTKLEELSDFYEVEEMNIKIVKKNSYMDIIITRDNIFTKDKIINYYIPNLDKKVLQIPIGHYINKDYLEEILLANMSDGGLPHCFIGATTGAGKSNFIRSVLLSWIMNYSPKELGLIIIDSQGGADYTTMLNAPHVLNNKCHSDQKEVESILDRLAKEVKVRNELLIKEEVINSVEYRAKGKIMPHKVIIMDEYASFEDRKEIEKRVDKIASNGRKVSIHLIIITQDANKDNINPTIKRNLPLRIGFRAANDNHSKNICEQQGLETLKVNGVGRAYGLPLDDDYVQFKAILAPSSIEVKKMIRSKYGGKKYEEYK